VVWSSLFLAVWVGLRFLVRWDPLPARAEANWPVGIRGWLLIPAIDAALTPLASLVSLNRDARFLDIQHWTHVRDTAPESLKVWVPVILLVFAVGGVFLIVLESCVAYLFFKRRTSTPRAFIGVQWFGFVYSVAAKLFLISAHLSGNWRGDVLAAESAVCFVTAAAYTAYFLISKRVKATFVVRRAGSYSLDGLPITR
jgi:hypothetical protein